MISIARRVAVLLVAVTVPLAGQPPSATSEQVFTVGTKDAPPFAFVDDEGEWQGFAIDLLHRLGDNLGLEIRLETRDLAGLLQGVEQGELDAAMAAITVTPDREATMDFSYPYAEASLGIAVRSGAKRGWFAGLSRLWRSPELWAVIACLAILQGVIGCLIWLVERRINPQHFGGTPIRGIGHGFWWAAVTMTTVGYGDKAPVSLAGRMIGLFWMFASLIIIAGFTAVIASSITLAEMTEAVGGRDDLARTHVGTVSATTGSDWLEREGIHASRFATIDDALDALDNEQLDAVVYDAPILRYSIHCRTGGGLHVLPDRLARGFYAIALPTASPWAESINRELLVLLGSEEINALEQRYFGSH